MIGEKGLSGRTPWDRVEEMDRNTVSRVLGFGGLHKDLR